ncbi:MAG: hypothetical protein K0A90_00085 [Methanosarcinaceae archaeon]|nr:hypothetical protein [Methanosarcinaceae archaeon]
MSEKPKMSLTGWNILTWIKGRKKTIITMVATMLMFYVTDLGVASVVAGSIIESGIAIFEYYLKQREL